MLYLSALIRQVTYSAVTQADRSRMYDRQGDAEVYVLGTIPTEQGFDEVRDIETVFDLIDDMACEDNILPKPINSTPPYQTFALLKGWGTDTPARQKARDYFRKNSLDLNAEIRSYLDQDSDEWRAAFLKVPGMHHRQRVLIRSNSAAEVKEVVGNISLLPEGTKIGYPRSKRS